MKNHLNRTILKSCVCRFHERLATKLQAASSLALTLILASLASPVLAVGELAVPDWENVFNPDGSYKDAVSEFGVPQPEGNGVPDYIDNGALDAIFIEDNLSDDVITDMSVRATASSITHDVVRNGTVTAVHDVGNSYVLVRPDSVGDMQLYVGVELLSPAQGVTANNSYVEIEFTQQFIHAVGVNAPIRGERSMGDLLVRVHFSNGVPLSAEFHRWGVTSDYQLIEATDVNATDGAPCDAAGMPYVLCTGEPPLNRPVEDIEVWDLYGAPVPSVAPDRFIELGLDVTALLGDSPEFSSILIRTSQDIALDSFRRMGYWAAGQHSADAEGGFSQ